MAAEVKKLGLPQRVLHEALRGFADIEAGRVLGGIGRSSNFQSAAAGNSPGTCLQA